MQTQKGVKNTLLKYGRDHYKKIGSKGGNPLLLKVREDKLKSQNEKPAGENGGLRQEAIDEQPIINL